MNNIAELLGKIEVNQTTPKRPDLPLNEWVDKLSEIIVNCVTPILKSSKNRGFKDIEFTAKMVNSSEYSELNSAFKSQETILKTAQKSTVVPIIRSIKFSMECLPNSIASLVINLSDKDKNKMRVALYLHRGKEFFQQENGSIRLSDLLMELQKSVEVRKSAKDPEIMSFTEIELIEMDLTEIYKS